MTRKILSALFILVIIASVSFAQTVQPEISCDSIVRQIHDDVIAFPASGASQYLPWMQLSWLTEHLGQPQSAHIRDHVFVWKNFSLFLGADGSMEHIGTLPDQRQAHTVDEITKIMGNPKKIYSEQLKLYQWVCPENPHNWIAMLVKKEGTSLSIMGSDCDAQEKNCEPFSAAYAESDLKQKFGKQMKAQTEITLNLLALRLKNYNDYFKTTLQNQSQLTESVLEKIRLYYSNLRECKKGVYQYVTPVLQDYLYQTSTIEKLENDHCYVNTYYKIPSIGKVSLKCQFSLENLGLFSDDEATSAARGFVKVDSNLQKLINKECKRYIEGVL